MKSNNYDSDMTVFLFAFTCVILFWLYKQVPTILHFIFSHKYLFGSFFSVAVTISYVYLKQRILKLREKNREEKILETKTEDSFYIGVSEDKKPIYLPESARIRHTQVVGTTSAGKTESVIIPWAARDIQKGRGFIIIDGKSDRSLLDKLYAYCVQHKRTKDFRLFSLVNINESHTYNPLTEGDPEEVAERVFASFTMENEYYKAVQFEIFKQVLMIFHKSKEIPTFLKLTQSISDPNILLALAEKGKDQLLINWAMRFKGLSKDTLDERTSGLLNQLGFFTSGKTAKLFNTEHPSINIEKAMEEGLIVYFQLPAMKTPTLGKATGKMLLQNIQSAVSSRHNHQNKDFPLFSIFLDDFTEYITPSFVTLLNKSRSANVGVVFAHQALGDLAVLGEAIKNTIITNANLKVFMRSNENESSEYFAKSYGTKQGIKITERQTKTQLGTEKTGEGSVREVEEFIYHPNIFKRDLGLGEAVMIVPMNKGTHAVRLRLDKLDDLDPIAIPPVEKSEPKLLELDAQKFTSNEAKKSSKNEILESVTKGQMA